MDIQPLAVAVAATMGVVEVVKKTGMPSRWAPLASLVAGVGMVSLFMQDLSVASVSVGIVTGLSAGGFFSGVKSVSGN